MYSAAYKLGPKMNGLTLSCCPEALKSPTIEDIPHQKALNAIFGETLAS